MDNICQFPDRELIAEEAATWLIRLDSEMNFSKTDKQQLGEWLSRSPVHREELREMNQFWSNNVVTELLVPLGRHEPEPNRWNQFWHWVPGTGLAYMSLLLVLFFGAKFWLIEEDKNGFYATAVGQQKTAILSDGSQVLLNTNSQIEVDYQADSRNIRILQGEAHFKVEKDTRRPFRVYAGSGRIQAVGTAFAVRLGLQDVSVIVTEGRVALASLEKKRSSEPKVIASDQPKPRTKQGPLDAYTESYTASLGELTAGKGVVLKAAVDADMNARPSVQKLEEVERKLAWRRGMLVFAGEPLSQVVGEISRYTSLSISFSDDTLRDIQIGGQFRVGDTEGMLEALQLNFGLQVTRTAYNRVVLSRSDTE